MKTARPVLETSSGTTWRSGVGGATLIALLAIIIGFHAEVAEAAPTWNPAAQEIAPPIGADPEFPFAKLEAVSCGAPGYCSAVGGYSEPDERQVMVVDQVAGVWQQAQKVLVPSGHEYPLLSHISCSSAGNCTATGVVDIGSESQGLIVSSHNGTWGTAQILPEPTDATWTWISDVSCPVDGECVAVGGFEENPSHLPSAPSHPFAVVESGGIWGSAVPIAVAGSPETSQLNEVDCPSVGNCSALGSIDGTKPIVASLSGGAWSTASELAAPGPGLLFVPNDLSCGAAGSCVVAGAYSESGKQRPAVAAQTAGDWGAPIPLALTSDVAAVNSHSDLDAVSCTAAGTCTALGSYLNSSEEEKAFTASQVSGNWQQAVQVAVDVPVEPSFPYALGWGGIDCVSAQSCGATGFAFFHGTTALMEGGSWGTGASPIVLPANAQSQEAGGIYSMSCGGAGACAAAGSFVDTEGMERAMALSTEGYAGSGGDPGGGGEGDGGGKGGTDAGSGGPSSTGAKPAPTPPASGGAAARLGAKAVPVKDDTALVPLKCPPGAACSGILKLLTSASTSASSSAILARANQAKILVGKKAFSVAPGGKATIKVPLTKRGKALVKASGKRGLKVTLTGSGVTRRSLVLKSSSRQG